jgi:hypothetical protein
MINCRNCINWRDESLEQIQTDRKGQPHIFMGCRIFGFLENNDHLQECKHYIVSENLFAVCSSCQLPVPKVCVSLGECLNCTDTDLFCVEHCIGENSRKYCTHFVRLNSEGMHLIEQDEVFDLFPKLGMPDKQPNPEMGPPPSKSLKPK